MLKTGQKFRMSVFEQEAGRLSVLPASLPLSDHSRLLMGRLRALCGTCHFNKWRSRS
jgi:hypothetical protein